MLASLAEKGEINERAFGKQKIYFAKQVGGEGGRFWLLATIFFRDQGQFAKLSAEELNALDDVSGGHPLELPASFACLPLLSSPPKGH